MKMISRTLSVHLSMSKISATVSSRGIVMAVNFEFDKERYNYLSYLLPR